MKVVVVAEEVVVKVMSEWWAAAPLRGVGSNVKDKSHVLHDNQRDFRWCSRW